MLTGTASPRSGLTESDVRAMFAVFERTYENVRFDRFERDLAEKEWVVLLRDGATIAGFSTLRMIEAGGRRAVFSGDTVVDRAHWDSHELPRAWGKLVFSLKGTSRLWWFLISKGYRTYLYLPVFFREFWPRHGAETPAEERAAIDALARSKYPREYDGASGLVRFAEPHGNLRAEMAEVPPHRAGDENVRYFLSRNPDYRAGTELCCLAEIAESNVTGPAKRILGLPR